MAGYNWEVIFKNKTEKELIEIYSGKSQLNFEAEIFAGLELKNRDYDFQKIEDIHKRKIEELKYMNTKLVLLIKKQLKHTC